jgi:hypothetical protein
MMVHILADIVKIVVFASSANALLRVDGASQFGHFQVRIAGAEKERFELIHA